MIVQHVEGISCTMSYGKDALTGAYLLLAIDDNGLDDMILNNQIRHLALKMKLTPLGDTMIPHILYEPYQNICSAMWLGRIERGKAYEEGKPRSLS